MLNYKNSITSYNKCNELLKLVNVSDLPTTVKSRSYQYSSHVRNNDNNPKYSTKNSHRMHQTKNDINMMINEMMAKKKDNLSALQRIKATNSQALNILNQDSSQQNSNYKKIYPEQQEQQQYQFLSPLNQDNYGPQQNQNQRSDAQFGGTQQNRNLTPLEQENIELRKALNSQVRQNNELLKRIKFLEAENEDLRNQLRAAGLQNSKALRSTNYNSINLADITKSQNRAQQQQIPSSYKNSSNPINNADIDNNLANNYSSRINVLNNQKSLMSELGQLKKQNQRLRQNAILLLRKTN